MTLSWQHMRGEAFIREGTCPMGESVRIVYNALHAMQTWSSDENSGCLSNTGGGQRAQRSFSV